MPSHKRLYKGLYIADIHMSNKLPGARLTADGRTDRLDDQVKLWKHVGATALDQGAEDIVIVGDLFDKALVDPVTLTTTVECLVDLPGKKRILPGNHDAASIRGGRFAVEAFGAFQRPDIHCLKTGVTFSPRPWIHFHPLAFMPVGDTRAALKTLRKIARTDGGHNVLLFHNSVLGASHLGWKCDDGLSPEEVCKGFDQVIAGHFHEHQRFGPEDQGMYLSAPMHHSYADVGRMAGYWLFEYSSTEGLVDATFVDPGLPKFHLVTVRDGRINLPKGARPGDFVRWNVHATGPEWIALKPQVSELVSKQIALGYRAEAKHKPIHTTEVRLAEEGEPSEDLSIDTQMSRWLKRTGSGALDFNQTLTEGRSILNEAKAAKGVT